MGDLLGPVEVRRLARQLGVRPTKSLGQNFVIDPNTVQRVVRAASLTPADVTVEVGPGLGSLTLALLPACRRVYAVEVDPVLAGALPETVRTYAPEVAERLSVVSADAMRITPSDLAEPAGSHAPLEPTALVANLPYNVAVPVVLHLLAVWPSLRHGVVMVQAEVADRLTAPPGSRVYGVPSAKLAWYAEARRVGPVPRSVFWPVPNVDSGLVGFTRRDPPSDTARTSVFEVIDTAFAQRRKTLRSALARWAGTAAAAEEILRSAGVDPGARGESLTVEQFARIAASGRRKGGAGD